MDTVTAIIPPINYNWSWNTQTEMNFPNMLTPPSSNEDSPQSLYFVASPESSHSKADGYSNVSHVYTSGMEMNGDAVKMEGQPYLQFIEQPTDKFRFRYKSEMAGTHGSLNGVSSDKSRKQTFPTVELKNFNQNAIIRCSIYQINSQDNDMKPHAHRLIKKYGKDEVDDPHDLPVSVDEGYVASFHSMGIIHTAKKNIVIELIKKKTELKKEKISRAEGRRRDLSKKEEVEIKQEAESESKSINLNIVCLKFEAFIESNGIFHPICQPIHSHGINNLKSALTGELKIVRMDHCTSPAIGNREIFLLVERVTKKNVKIRFFELDDEDREVWEDYGKFTDLDVHHQYAIVFKTPSYKDVNISSKVKVYMELLRPTDGARSDPKEFTYSPSDAIYKPGFKRSRPSTSTSYDSSNIASDELPATVNLMGIEPSWENPLFNNSKEFEKAYNDVDSEEFQKLYQSVLKDLDYNDIVTDGHASLKQTRVDQSIKLEVSSVEQKNALDAVNQLQDLIKTKPTVDRVIKMLEHYFGNNGETNPLHVFIQENNQNNVIIIFKLIFRYKQFHLFNKCNSHGQSALHLSVICNNFVFAKSLLDFKVNPLIEDRQQNTPLHLACKYKCSIEILELLIKYSADNLDVTNCDGDTPLNIALEKRHMAAIKLLLNNGADVNKRHNNNGFTPLRFALESRYEEGVRFILSNPKLDPLQTDFNGVSALQAALLNNADKNILDLVKSYMADQEINYVVKEEMDCDSSNDEMEIDLNEPMTEIKEEVSEEHLEIMYNKVKSFTPKALDEISSLIDMSGMCEYLAELLELDHLLRCGIFKSSDSVSKCLLKHSVETNKDSLWVIRNFLHNLEQTAAVLAMDEMVKTCYNDM